MLIETDGIVLKRRKISNSDVFITVLTRKLGKIEVFAKGASNPRSGLNKGVHPFVVGAFSLRGEKTYNLASVDVIQAYYHLREDLKRLAYGSYFLDLADRALQEGETNHGLYALLLESIEWLARREGVEEKLKLHFEIRMLRVLGLQPQTDSCVHCGARQDRFHAFDVPGGGVVCNDCHTRGQLGIRIHSTQVALIAYVLKERVETLLDKPIDRLLLEKMDILMNSYMDYHLGLTQLKSRKFLKIYE